VQSPSARIFTLFEQLFADIDDTHHFYSHNFYLQKYLNIVFNHIVEIDIFQLYFLHVAFVCLLFVSQAEV